GGHEGAGSVSIEEREVWTCIECSVGVFKPNQKTKAPKGWDRGKDRCLSCKRRERREEREKAKQADPDAPGGWREPDAKKPTKAAPPAEAVERARVALRDDADRTDAAVAKASGTSRKIVAFAREELDLPKHDGRKGKGAPKVEALLRDDPER